MWDKSKTIKILRYYSFFAILMSIFFIMNVNEYFPPMNSVAKPAMVYLEAKNTLTLSADEKANIEQLITNQKIAMQYDEHVDSVKNSITILSGIFLVISVLIFMDSWKTRDR